MPTLLFLLFFDQTIFAKKKKDNALDALGLILLLAR